MRFLTNVQVLSLVSCGAFLATAAIPVSGAKDQSRSSEDLTTSNEQTKTANSSGTGLTLQQPVQAGSQGTSKEAQPPPDAQRSEPTASASEFLKMAELVYLILDKYPNPYNNNELGIPCAFGGDIQRADRQETWPLKTITIIVLDHRLEGAAKAALKKGRTYGEATLEVTGQDSELKAELKRVGFPTVSAPIEFIKPLARHPGLTLALLKGHSDIGHLPIYKYT